MFFFGYASGFKILSAEAVLTTYPLLRKQILHAWQRKVLLFLSNKKIRVEHIARGMEKEKKMSKVRRRFLLCIEQTNINAGSCALIMLWASFLKASLVLQRPDTWECLKGAVIF